MTNGMKAARGRSFAVLGVLLGGAIALLAATQPWLALTLTASDALLDVDGTSAVPILMPLALAALALGAALSIVGRTLRYIFAVLLLAFATVSTVAIFPIVFGTPPVASYASVVTEHSGIAGEASVAQLVDSVSVSMWPIVALVAQALLAIAGVWVLLSAASWRVGGRRYEAAGTTHTGDKKDAIDSWDELSHGDDPTSGDPGVGSVDTFRRPID